MEFSPPNGSSIKLLTNREHNQIIVPHGSGGILRYFMGAFLIVWLCGWSVGWLTTFSQIMRSESLAANGFLLFWIAGWTLGGAFAGYMVYRIFRKSIPESYQITADGIQYDTGCEPFKMSFDFRSQQEMMKRLIQKRKTYFFTIEEVASLRIREHGTGNRLTIDKDAKRLNLAPNATEIEREWLHGFLSKYYSVEQVAAGNVR